MISRSSHESFCRCPREFYYRYLYSGKGWDSATTPLPLALGLGTHKGMEVLLTTGDVEAAVAASVEEWQTTSAGLPGFQREEGGALVEALIRGWYRVRYASFLEEYEVLTIEKEVRTLLASNVTLMARADVVVRRRADGAIFVVNWKTSGTKDNWNQKWSVEVQTWTEALAIEQDLGERVAGVLYEGFYKGQYRDEMNHTPLLYGYRLETPVGTMYSGTYKRSTKEAPWKKFAAWQEGPVEGGIAGWVNWLPFDVVKEQFLVSPPILKNDDVVADWIRQVVRRETDIEHILEVGSDQDKLDFFWQNWKEINCGRCIFKPVCKKETSIEDMVEEGFLRKRVDHHGEGEE